MKLITLNIWGGHIRRPLLDFIKLHQYVDVFCFQEVYHNAESKISDEDRENTLNILTEIHHMLPGFNAFFRPVVGKSYGIGIFIKKDFEVIGEGEILIHENPDYLGFGPAHSRILQWLECRCNDRPYSIMNVHGLWNGKGKTDTPERIAQSRRIKEFVESISIPKIICGDFNLKPDTESIRIIENGMRNLIQEHQVRSTRTSYYEKEERFADYIFTCPHIAINKFEVLKDEVSDHTPILLDFH